LVVRTGRKGRTGKTETLSVAAFLATRDS
jgi:hypothetical protein